MKKLNKYFKAIVLIIGTSIAFTNCSDFLDVVPDGTATMETVFSNRANSEKFFYTCYNGLPNFADAGNYPGNIGGDDYWWDEDITLFKNSNGGYIARGFQNSSSPYQNYWDGDRGGKNLWTSIRNCNIFIDNIDKVPDLQDWERDTWKAEVKVLKAYYHLFLMQLYGPIPIVEESLEVSADPDMVKVYREPVDSVVSFIIRTIDDAIEYLPLQVDDLSQEAGRMTIPIALTIKAKALVWAASPLFNGSFSYYDGFVDNRGVTLIGGDGSSSDIQARWEKAAVAIKNAIDTCELAGHDLFRFDPGFQKMSDTTALKYTLRGVASERVNLNPEIIWPCMKSNNDFQNRCTPMFYDYDNGGGSLAEICATMKMAELFYTNNGLPIEQDPNWNYGDRYATREDTGRFHRYYVEQGGETANLNFFREPRFYANLGFDRGIYELINNDEENPLIIHNKSGEAHGFIYEKAHISTGYFVKKQVSYRIPTQSPSPSPYRFSIPIYRLADLYLLYAEALNEANNTPTEEVYEMVDKVRARAGLKGVRETWQMAAAEFQNDPNTKEGMRNIIKRERLIELAFEGQRTFDLRRWLDAMDVFNEPVRGWDYQGTTAEDYYQRTVYLTNRGFSYRNYLWPIKNSTLTVNSNLVQNPGW